MNSTAIKSKDLQGRSILVVSFLPTHPQIAGNRTRIYTLLMNIKKLGYQIHFLYLQRRRWAYFCEGKADIAAMKECWDGFSRISVRYNLFPLFDRLLGQAGRCLRQLTPKLYSLLSPFRSKIQKYTSCIMIDHWYNSAVNRQIKRLIAKNEFKYVICEYVFTSAALELFDASTVKIIDTHDNLTRVFTLDAENEQTRILIKNEEKKALKRADVIIAIQEQERKYFFKLLDNEKKVVTIGHTAELVRPDSRAENRNNILFIGANFLANQLAVSKFIKEVLPKVRLKLPDARLLVAGDVCKDLSKEHRCLKLGRLKDISQAYREADVVINPVSFGAGLKIKSIEALGYAKPTVMSSHAAIGLEEGINEAFLVADQPEQMAQTIIELLTNPARYRELSQRAYQFAKSYNQRQLNRLKEILPQISPNLQESSDTKIK